MTKYASPAFQRKISTRHRSENAARARQHRQQVSDPNESIRLVRMLIANESCTLGLEPIVGLRRAQRVNAVDPGDLALDIELPSRHHADHRGALVTILLPLVFFLAAQTAGLGINPGRAEIEMKPGQEKS